MTQVVHETPIAVTNPLPLEEVSHAADRHQPVEIFPDGQESVAPIEQVYAPGVLGDRGLREAGLRRQQSALNVYPFPVIPGSPNAVDPVRRPHPATLEQVDPHTVISGLEHALQAYTGSAGDATTANQILADLRRGPAGRHDGVYDQRLAEATTYAAYLLRDRQETSDYAVKYARTGGF